MLSKKQLGLSSIRNFVILVDEINQRKSYEIPLELASGIYCTESTPR